MKQVFLTDQGRPETQSIPDPFYGGLLTTEPPAPMTFALEEELLNQLSITDPLMGQVFFNGMPLEPYLRIRDGIRRIHRLEHASRARPQYTQRTDQLCDATWEAVTSQAQEALRLGLCIDERSQE